MELIKKLEKNHWYLTKEGGSTSYVYDMSRTRLRNMADIIKYAESANHKVSSIIIRFIRFDKRVGFFVWHILADWSSYPQSHLLTVYSCSDSEPYIDI